MNTVLDLSLSHETTDQAVNAAGRAICEARKEEMRKAIDLVAATHDTFTADEIWEVLGKPKNRVDGSGLGFVLRTAASAGVICLTEATFRRSLRPEAHRKPLPVWKSLTYQV